MNTAAWYAPMPTARNMYPSWLIVEYASTRLMSGWMIATVPASSAVSAPTHADDGHRVAAHVEEHMGAAHRKMPAVTIVAAWISAETGVGPSIASGNHRWSGICALLPMRRRQQQRDRGGRAVCDRLPRPLIAA